MEKSLESSIKTTATPEDLKVIDLIISKMSLLDGYYGEFTKVHAELKYKEFSTLSDDYKSFHREIVLNSGKYSVMELASLKRSLIMLRDKNKLNATMPGIWFQNFLNESILTLDTWLNEILKQIIEEV